MKTFLSKQQENRKNNLINVDLMITSIAILLHLVLERRDKMNMDMFKEKVVIDFQPFLMVE